MNELTVFNRNGQLYTDSRDVAKMVGKDHKHLLRDINGYCSILEKTAEPKIGLSDFFKKSTYKDSTGRTLPCYLITKKGCEFVANKLTGEKGVLFTVAYINAFTQWKTSLSVKAFAKNLYLSRP